jgi:phosphatidylglycerophosphate synthase
LLDVGMHTLAEIQARTYKSVDAWWTVLLVDPLAGRLVRRIAGHRWATPNRLTALAAAFSLAAAACFAGQGRGWLIAGAFLFHFGFVADCMDGKIARLTGTGSLFGAWFDFMSGRLRTMLCAAALMGGQYARTGQARYLWLAALVIALDLLRYLNAGQLARIRAAMEAEPGGTGGPLLVPAQVSRRGRVKAALRRRRIRVHLMSGVEFQMFVFIVGPLVGSIVGTTLVAGVLLAAFEAHLVHLMWRATRQHAEWISPSRTHLVLQADESNPYEFQPERQLAVAAGQLR